MRERGSDGKGEREWKLERTEEMRQEVQDCVSDTVYQRLRVSLKWSANVLLTPYLTVGTVRSILLFCSVCSIMEYAEKISVNGECMFNLASGIQLSFCSYFPVLSRNVLAFDNALKSVRNEMDGQVKSTALWDTLLHIVHIIDYCILYETICTNKQCMFNSANGI